MQSEGGLFYMSGQCLSVFSDSSLIQHAWFQNDNNDGNGRNSQLEASQLDFTQQ